MHTALSQLFPANVLVLGGRVEDWQGELLPEEQALIAPANAKRQREFTAVRTMARQALASLGVRDFALLPNEDRTPRWPEGIVGSITHTHEWCALAIGWQVEVGGLGLDMEVIERVTPPLWEKILMSSERAWVEQQPGPEQIGWAATIFSAKEAYYKFQYPRTRRWLGFADVEIVVEATEQITARAIDGEKRSGHIVRYADCVLAGFSGNQ